MENYQKEQLIKCCGVISAAGSFQFKISQFFVRSILIKNGMKCEKCFDLLHADQARQSHI